jgi:hypothetical protein
MNLFNIAHRRCLCRHLASRSRNARSWRGSTWPRASSQFSPRSNSTAPVAFIDGLSDSLHAFLEAEKRSRREVSVVINSVPTWLDTPHIGFVVIDVMGNAHCDVPYVGQMIIKPNGHRWTRIQAISVGTRGESCEIASKAMIRDRCRYASYVPNMPMCSPVLSRPAACRGRAIYRVSRNISDRGAVFSSI